MNVQVLAEAQQDLANGYRFYEKQVAGLGEYFLDSLFSDIDSLQFCAGVHARHFGYSRIASRRASRGYMPFWIAAEIHPGFATG